MRLNTVRKAVALLILIPAMVCSSCGNICRKDRDSQNTGGIESINDLDGRRVAVLAGSVQDLYLSDSHPECRTMRMESISDMYIMLENGNADALLTSSCSWIFESAAYDDIKCVCDTIAPNPIGVVFRKGDVELREKFNAFLDTFSQTDEFSRMQNEWQDVHMVRRMPEYSDEECPNGTMTVATAAVLPPFTYIRDGQVVGLEMELVTRFAASIGMKVNAVNMNFSSVIPYMASGKAMMATAFMCITKERAQSVDFSNPWTYESMALIVKNNAAQFADARQKQGFKAFWLKTKTSFERNILQEKRYNMLLQGLSMTVLISLLAALLGTMLGILLCWGSLHRNGMLSKSCNVYIEFMRCMPQVVFLMIMFYIVFGKTQLSGTAVAIIAFALCFGAYTSVIFRTAVKSVDKGQTEAALAMGFTRFKSFWYFILPQVIQRALPVYKGEFIGLIKATSIVGYIAVFDLTKAGDVIRSRTYEAFFPLIVVTIIYFLVIWLLSALLKYAEVKTQPRRRKYFK